MLLSSALQGALTRLDAYITGRMAQARTPGMVLALFDREECLRVSTYGFADLEAQVPVTPGTLFQIGSITKSFTALAVVQAAEAGLLDLHAPVTAYLPWFEVQTEYGPITIHHLLNHSAGLVGVIDKSPDVRGAVWALRDTRAAGPPGAKFSYSDAGYQALTLVLEAVTGRPYADIIRAGIFGPLDMAASNAAITHSVRPRLAKGYTYLYDDRPHHPDDPLVLAPWIETASGDCCIVSTAEDMASYARMLLNRGQGPDGPVLSPEGYDQLTRHLMTEEWGEYGYGLMVRRRDGFTHIGHSGGMPGYTAEMLVDIDNGVGLVLLSTHRHPPGLPWAVMGYWRAAYLGVDEALASIELPPLPPNPTFVENAAEYAGTYSGTAGGEMLTLSAEEGRLVLHHKGEQVTLERRGDDSFYVDHPDFRLFLLGFGRAAPAREGDSTDERATVVEAWHGASWYANDAYGGAREFACPPEWAAYVGHYRAHIPWQTNFRVVLRKGRLWLVWPPGDEDPLFPLENGAFAVGEESSPEQLQFSDIAGGQALRATLTTCDYYRFFTP
ncbi:MAG TPA: serine hydrolase domain-containing protein [Chloroflexia bacterium]